MNYLEKIFNLRDNDLIITCGSKTLGGEIVQSLYPVTLCSEGLVGSLNCLEWN
jgi:hypothetical protein